MTRFIHFCKLRKIIYAFNTTSILPLHSFASEEFRQSPFAIGKQARSHISGLEGHRSVRVTTDVLLMYLTTIGVLQMQLRFSHNCHSNHHL